MVRGAPLVLLALLVGAPSEADAFWRFCRHDSVDPTCWYCADVDLTGGSITCTDLMCGDGEQCVSYTAGPVECCIPLVERLCCPSCAMGPPDCSSTSCRSDYSRCFCMIPGTGSTVTCDDMDAGVPVPDAGTGVIDGGPARDAGGARIDAGPARDAGSARPDAGPISPPDELTADIHGGAGCACTVAGAHATASTWPLPTLLLLFAALARRRRRRPARSTESGGSRPADRRAGDPTATRIRAPGCVPAPAIRARGSTTRASETETTPGARRERP